MIRIGCIWLVLALATLAGPARPATGASPDSPKQRLGPAYDIEMGRMIPMRDGVALEAWITRPSHLAGKAPAVLELTQYDIDGSRRHEATALATRAYVFVHVEVRGRGRSGAAVRARPLASISSRPS